MLIAEGLGYPAVLKLKRTRWHLESPIYTGPLRVASPLMGPREVVREASLGLAENLARFLVTVQGALRW